MKTKSRFVLDTNVLISAALFPTCVPGRVLDKVILEGTALFIDDTLRELEQTLRKDNLRKFFSEKKVNGFLQTFSSVAEQINVEQNVTLCRDPKDNKFLELALSGKADFIISGDGDLLELHPFETIPVISPSDFLNG